MYVGSHEQEREVHVSDIASFVLWNDLWEEHFESTSINIWEERKLVILYVLSNPVLTLPPGLGDIAGVNEQNSKVMSQEGKPGTSCILMYVCVAPPTPVGAWSMALGLWRHI